MIAHSRTICPAVTSLRVKLSSLAGGGLKLRYQLCGDLSQLCIPSQQATNEVEGLWQDTCFEFFVAVEGSSRYREFNFSPSGQWAAFEFNNYRERNQWKAHQAPRITVNKNNHYLVLNVDITAVNLPSNANRKALQLGLTAVIKDAHGECSYWALFHPTEQPDFHHRDGFTCTLEDA